MLALLQRDTIPVQSKRSLYHYFHILGVFVPSVEPYGVQEHRGLVAVAPVHFE